jgi:anti-sigma factor RsiW
MNCKDIGELSPLYLSGEMEGEQRELFLEHLAACRSCAGQMNLQVALDERIHDALSSELPDGAAIERSVRARIAGERSRRWAIAGGAAAAVLFAAVLGYRSMRTEGLYADAARDHRLEVMEHQPRRWRTDPPDIEKLTARYGLSNHLAALTPAGYRLEHAKMCGLDGSAALHLVYTNGVQEFSFYVRPRTAGVEGLRTASVGPEHLARFESDRLEGVIVTAGSGDECLQFARVAVSLL